MRKTDKRFPHKAIVGIIIGVLVLFVSVFLGRNLLLNRYVNSRIAGFCATHDAKITYKSIRFSGFKSIIIENLDVHCTGKPSVFKADSIIVSARLLPLFKGQVSVEEVFTSDIILNAINTKTLNNFRSLLGSPDSTKSTSHNYSEKVNNLVKKLFRVIPNELRSSNTHLVYVSDSFKVDCTVPVISIIDGKMVSRFDIKELDKISSWTSTGMISKDEEIIDVKLLPVSSKTPMPYLFNKLNIYGSFNSISVALTDFSYADDVFSFHSSGSIEQLKISNSRIANDTVIVQYAFADMYLKVAGDNFIVDSNSVTRLGNLKLRPYLVCNPKKGEILMKLKMNSPAQDFFDALPKGLFSNLEGIEAKGTLIYNGELSFSKREPDSVVFISELNGVDFNIVKYGKNDLRKMNGEFVYTAYDKGKAVRSFPVGPGNSDFVSLNTISPNLKAAVMTSEDGNFYGHKGFNLQAFRQSIAANYKAKRFVRGGSTISMQLIKNVFLNRNKTVARKLEEAIIVWIIENKRLTSKERMLEVYFNIIEWGPNVYGAQEAARFYFNKPASDISMNEAIFMAMIVPRPKGFMYNFEKDGTLKPFTNAYFQLMKRHLLRKSYVMESDSISPSLVSLKGPALKYVLKVDSIPKDTLELPEIF